MIASGSGKNPKMQTPQLLLLQVEKKLSLWVFGMLFFFLFALKYFNIVVD